MRDCDPGPDQPPGPAIGCVEAYDQHLAATGQLARPAGTPAE